MGHGRERARPALGEGEERHPRQVVRRHPIRAGASYWQNHRTIQLDLLTEQREYEVFGAFHSKDYTKGKDETEAGFWYYEYIDLRGLKAFTEYVKGVKDAAFYDTGIEPQWGEQLLTLSTCSYHTDHGMFVVVARWVG